MAVDTSGLRQAIAQGAVTAVEIATPMLIDSLVGLVWDWQSGGDRDEFPEHVALNGAFGATLGAFGGWTPGDHAGCRCVTVEVRETAVVQSITGGAGSAVATVEFGAGFDEQPLSVSLSAGGLSVTVSGGSMAGGWDALVVQLEDRWPEACQRALDGGAIGG